MPGSARASHSLDHEWPIRMSAIARALAPVDLHRKSEERRNLVRRHAKLGSVLRSRVRVASRLRGFYPTYRPSPNHRELSRVRFRSFGFATRVPPVIVPSLLSFYFAVE